MTLEVVTVTAADDDITGVSNLARESFQEARLPRTIGSDESDDLTHPDVEVDVV